MYQAVTRHEYVCPNRPAQADYVAQNTATAKLTSWIQHHGEKFEQWRQMVDSKYVFNHQLPDSLEENYFRHQPQEYTN